MSKPSPEQAKQAGRYARKASRGRDTCPRYGITPDARVLREQWYVGWDAEGRERKRAAN